MFPSLIPVISFGGGFAIILLSGLSAWSNLVQKKISKFGLDIVFVKLAKLVDREKAMSLYTDPHRIRWMGIMMLLVVLGGIQTLFWGK
jgi:hypothetical protein